MGGSDGEGVGAQQAHKQRGQGGGARASGVGFCWCGNLDRMSPSPI